MSSKALYYATGKRKTAVARVWMQPGTGQIIVNKRKMEDYFGRRTLQVVVQQPLKLTNTLGAYDIIVNVKGGGPTGQAEAIRHGIALALQKVNYDDFRPILKKAGLLTRDAREKERKKYGLAGARRAFQFSKR